MLGMDVHFACCFGETVYYISEVDNITIKEAVVRGFRFYQYCTLYDVYDKEENRYFVLESDEIYFTREEAEKAIKGGEQRC